VEGVSLLRGVDGMNEREEGGGVRQQHHPRAPQVPQTSLATRPLGANDITTEVARSYLSSVWEERKREARDHLA
jgi:hypothetical protein